MLFKNDEMRKTVLTLLSILFLGSNVLAQGNYNSTYNQIDTRGNVTQRNDARSDTLSRNKEIPKGIKEWTIDSRFGERTVADIDTTSHMFQNSVFTSGKRGEYNTTGNMGSPRMNRIFIYRPENEQFWFTEPYDYFIVKPENFHSTNTLSPFTNLTYFTAGNRTNGDDHFKAKFGVNVGKKIGIGFNFDYIYARGYYSDQSTSHFNYTLYGSYVADKYAAHLVMSTNHQKVTENGGITNDYFITHPETFDDDYQASEIPTVMNSTWNRNDNQHIFFNHRYNIGFHRKVKMTEEEIAARKFAIESKRENDAEKEKEKARRRARQQGEYFDEEEYDKTVSSTTGRPDDATIVETSREQNDSTATSSERISVEGVDMANKMAESSKKEETESVDTTWMKNEYVPVTSFVHTVQVDNYKRIFQAYRTPIGYYPNGYYDIGTYSGDSIYDKTTHYRIRNTFAISLLEGFNKWAKTGIKAFITSDLRHFSLPDTTETHIAKYNEHNLSIGGEMSKRQGKTFHYSILFETWLLGEDSGQMNLDANADVNLKVFGDTLRVQAFARAALQNPGFYFRHYHSRRYWWDNTDLKKSKSTRLGGWLSYDKTKTRIGISFDRIADYAYIASSHDITENVRGNYTLNVRQHDHTINLLTATLEQDIKLGPVNLQNVLTLQKSSNDNVLPLPTLNIYSNLFFRFKIAHVLNCDIGADMRYFTKYRAPEYSPAIGRFVTQESDDITEIGNYPIINAYANFKLKQTRFFIMMSHINAGSFNRGYFFTPHYPLNQRVLRFGVSWNFFN